MPPAVFPPLGRLRAHNNGLPSERSALADKAISLYPLRVVRPHRLLRNAPPVQVAAALLNDHI